MVLFTIGRTLSRCIFARFFVKNYYKHRRKKSYFVHISGNK